MYFIVFILIDLVFVWLPLQSDLNLSAETVDIVLDALYQSVEKETRYIGKENLGTGIEEKHRNVALTLFSWSDIKTTYQSR